MFPGRIDEEGAMITQTPDWLCVYEDQLDNGDKVQLEYDREGDVLEIVFSVGSARGLELTNEIVLRYDPQSAKPLSLIFLTFSHLLQAIESGQENFRFTNLAKLPQGERDRVLQILTTSPVSQYLTISTLSLTLNHKHLTSVLNREQQVPTSH